MKQVTEKSVYAFKNEKNFKRSNTEVSIYKPWIISFYLFGYCIATYNRNKNYLIISDCGRKTKTTKERLNWILQAFDLGGIFQKKGVRYYENNWTIEEFEWRKKFVF